MRLLIIGLGSMGKRRIRNLKRAGITDVVGFDPKPERREEATKNLGIEAVADVKDGMARNPTAVIISTPPNLHMGYAMMAAQAGKHFFTEAGTSAEGLAEVDAVARDKGIVAAASCTMRYQPSIKKMKELIAQGAIGRVMAYTHHCGQWLPDWHPDEDYRTFYVSRRETGACREIVPFELTWINWLVGDDPAQVAGMKAKVSKLDCDIDDLYQLLIRYRSGAIGHVQVDVLARAPVRGIRLVGSEGTLEWSLTDRRCKLFRAGTAEWEVFEEPAPKIEPGYSEMSNEAMYDEEIAGFLAAIRGETRWGNSLTDDLATLEVLFAAEKADGQGQAQAL